MHRRAVPRLVTRTHPNFAGDKPLGPIGCEKRGIFDQKSHVSDQKPGIFCKEIGLLFSLKNILNEHSFIFDFVIYCCHFWEADTTWIHRQQRNTLKAASF